MSSKEPDRFAVVRHVLEAEQKARQKAQNDRAALRRKRGSG
jgi:hypothetical protein